MLSFSVIMQPVAEQLVSFDAYYRAVLNVPNPALRMALNYLLREPGKRIRPALVYLAAGATGTISHTSSVAAAMVELVHNASLIHDDVIDRGLLRRKLPALSRVWGEKGAVLTGDYLLAQGLKLAVDSQQYPLLQFMNRAVQQMATSELTQLQRALWRSYDERGYLEVITGKTAALFSTCTAVGAFSTGAEQRTVEHLHAYGHFLGLAFQIRDDLLDYQPTVQIGKNSGNDLQEGRVTLPLIHTMNQLKTPLERHALRCLFQRARRNPLARVKLRKRVLEAGGIEYAQGRIQAYTQQAIDALSELAPSAYHTSLLQLAQYLQQRKV